jgi:polysaccharide export outer membrane protein
MSLRRYLGLLLSMLYAFGAPLFAQSHPEPQLRERPRYLLRAGDVLQLQYRLTPEFNQSVTVQPDGYIDINIGGEIYIAGLTVTQAHDLILQKETSRLKDPELNLMLEEFTRPYVVVAGEVNKPGQIEVRDQMSALSSIMLAGGFTNNAKSGQIIVFRKVNDSIAEVHELNLTRVTKTAQLEHDMSLQPGDMVYVPHDRVSRLQHYMQLSSLGFNLNPTTF